MSDQKRLIDTIDPLSLIFLAFILGGTIKGVAEAVWGGDDACRQVLETMIEAEERK